MFDLEKILPKVSAIKLPGGVVGKTCAVLIVASISIGGLAAITRNDGIIVAAISAIFLMAFVLLWRLINFADRHPQAALLEGSEFLLHTQMVLGSKGNPVITIEPESNTEERPLHLPPEEQAQLNQPEAAPALPPADEPGGRH